MKTIFLNRKVLLPALAVIIGVGGAFAGEITGKQKAVISTYWEGAPENCNPVECDVNFTGTLCEEITLYTDNSCDELATPAENERRQ